MTTALRIHPVLTASLLIACSLAEPAAAQPRAVRESPAPDWNHIRSIGERLGVPRAITIGEGLPQSFAIPGEWPVVDAIAEIDGIRYHARSSSFSGSTSVHATSSGLRPFAGCRAVVADFNGDGTIDIAAVLDGSANLQVYLGQPDGGLAQSVIALAAAPIAMATGDADGDGTLDLVVAFEHDTAVTLLHGDGRGGFVRGGSIDAGVLPARDGIRVAEIDGDGRADIVAIGSEGAASVFLSTRGAAELLPDALVSRRPSSLAATADAAAYEGIAGIALSPTTIAGGSGAASTGTITLNAPAPAGGVVVTLASSNPELAVSVPSIVVPAGASSATFVVGSNRNYRRYSRLAFEVTISATHGSTTRTAILAVTAQPAPGPLSSFDAQNEGQMCFGVGVRQSEQGISLEFGSAGNLFDCVPPPDPVGQDGTCTFRQECAFGCERRPPSNGFRFSDVCAATGPYPIAVSPKLVTGGAPSTATLQLSAPAPANSSGVVSSATVLANTIPNISTPIPAGAVTSTANVLTARVNTPRFAPIDASYYTPRADGSVGGRLGLTWLALVPGAPPPFELTSFEFDPPNLTSVTGGTSVLAFAQMNQVAPAPAVATASLTLASSHPSVASFGQSEVAFTEGSSGRGVFVQTSAVAADTVVTLSATVGTTTLTKNLTVRATPTATRVNSFFLDPFDVPGGTPASGLVVLDGAAPAGGAVVTLTSNNTAAATMPASVTVPAGSDRVSFTITTSPVSSNTTVGLTARFNGTFAATSLIVTASAPPPVPPAPALVSPANGATVSLPVTLDWSDVGAASSYQLQVDDSSAFAAPFVVDQPVTASQFSVASLAARQHWWRVRGINSAGTAGAWSVVRSLTPQAAPPPPGTTLTLTVKASGRSGSRIVSSPAGINVPVGSTGVSSFASGTQITLSVSTGRDAIWSGACSSGGNKRRTCTFTITANASVSANVQ